MGLDTPIPYRRRASMKLSKRITLARKILLREDPYIVIARKPKGMVRPCSGEHVYAALRAVVADYDASFLATYRGSKDEAARELGDLAENSYFAGADTISLFALLRARKPRRVIEVGSGNSTQIMRRALGAGSHITAIDPAPRAAIAEVANEVIAAHVLEVPLARLADLAAGDVLFIDGSHYAFNGTDVPYLFLEVIAALPRGVVVHVHDICLPYEYDALYSWRWYSEQYVLGGLLLGGVLRVLWSVHYLWRTGAIAESGSSIWLVRA